MPAGTKELRRRIKSVGNTKKITYAMKLVSAAKLRKAQEAVASSREYTDALTRMLGELSSELAGDEERSHPLLTARDQVRRVRVIVIGGSRGLCGAYNSNVHKRIEAFARERAGIELSWTLIGKKPAEHFRRIRRAYESSYETLSEDPNSWPFDEFVGAAERAFLEGEVDEVWLLYTRFRSALSMSVVTEKLLPMDAAALSRTATVQESASVAGATLFEPSAAELFSALLPRILQASVRQAALDAKASEHGSRMTAMDSATKNASDLARRLQLRYNKLRQSGITAELLDIIGGAEAIS